MVSTVLLSMMALGILQSLIFSYQVGAKARATDHARFFVKSFADQFLTQPTQDSQGNLLPMFSVTSSTGYGLSWTITNPDGTQTTVNGGASPDLAAPYISIPLGDVPGSNGTNAQITRTVWYLNPPVFAPAVATSTPGVPTLTQPVQSAGYILRADFTVTFTTVGKSPPPITVSVLRSVP